VSLELVGVVDAEAVGCNYLVEQILDAVVSAGVGWVLATLWVGLGPSDKTSEGCRGSILKWWTLFSAVDACSLEYLKFCISTSCEKR